MALWIVETERSSDSGWDLTPVLPTERRSYWSGDSQEWETVRPHLLLGGDGCFYWSGPGYHSGIVISRPNVYHDVLEYRVGRWRKKLVWAAYGLVSVQSPALDGREALCAFRESWLLALQGIADELVDGRAKLKMRLERMTHGELVNLAGGFRSRI